MLVEHAHGSMDRGECRVALQCGQWGRTASASHPPSQPTRWRDTLYHLAKHTRCSGVSQHTMRLHTSGDPRGWPPVPASPWRSSKHTMHLGGGGGPSLPSAPPAAPPTPFAQATRSASSPGTTDTAAPSNTTISTGSSGCKPRFWHTWRHLTLYELPCMMDPCMGDSLSRACHADTPTHVNQLPCAGAWAWAALAMGGHALNTMEHRLAAHTRMCPATGAQGSHLHGRTFRPRA
jgi:hypothetical protein